MPRASSVAGTDWGGVVLLAIIVTLIGLSILFGRLEGNRSEPPEDGGGDGGARQRRPRPRRPRGDHPTPHVDPARRRRAPVRRA
jgi:hypothetical protein